MPTEPTEPTEAQSLQSLQSQQDTESKFQLAWKACTEASLEIHLHFTYLEHEHSYLTLTSIVLVRVADLTQFRAYCYFNDGVWCDELLSWQHIQRTVLQIIWHK